MVLVSPPKYAVVPSHLANRIRPGSFRVGSCLPSENKLQEHCCVRRTTVCQSLVKLRHADLVVSVYGQGNEVLGATTRPLGQSL